MPANFPDPRRSWAFDTGYTFDTAGLKFDQYIAPDAGNNYRTEYAIAGEAGGLLYNIEQYMRLPPRSLSRVPGGSVVRTAMSGRRRLDGQRLVEWLFDAAYYTDLNTLVTTVYGGWDVQSVTMSIRTLGADDAYTNYNVEGYVPVPGEDYDIALNGKLRNLRLTFYVIE